MHDYAARDFLDTGILEKLAGRFRLAFASTDRLTLDLSPYGPIVSKQRLAPWRYRIYRLAASFWHLVVRETYVIVPRYGLIEAAAVGGARLFPWIRAFWKAGAAKPLSLFLRQILRVSTPNLIAGERPSAILVYTSVRSFFADDIVRNARTLDIPLLALTNNWDNLNTKCFLEIPQYLGVWGEQAFLIARLLHQIPAHRIFVVGSPRFEIYRGATPSREAAAAKLSIPSKRKVILFCGSGVPFDEVSLLQELDDSIKDGRLPADLYILYKPHPIRWTRTSETPLDECKFKNVAVFAATNRTLTELEVYPALFAASTAVISPFSTMVMEGARHGLPSLCLGYNDPAHSALDWGRAAFNLHLYAMRHADWAVICESRADFLSSCRKLISLIDRPEIADLARASAEFVTRSGQSPTADRLVTALTEIMNGRDADQSFMASKARTAPELIEAPKASLSKD